ncbi:hypothetical protein HK101_011129 [Irineochytrium annulatum]|nr:hypothetical protein HK101_011129 [Irineochytrium annulatum]
MMEAAGGAAQWSRKLKATCLAKYFQLRSDTHTPLIFMITLEQGHGGPLDVVKILNSYDENVPFVAMTPLVPLSGELMKARDVG